MFRHLRHPATAALSQRQVKVFDAFTLRNFPHKIHHRCRRRDILKTHGTGCPQRTDMLGHEKIFEKHFLVGGEGPVSPAEPIQHGLQHETRAHRDRLSVRAPADDVEQFGVYRCRRAAIMAKHQLIHLVQCHLVAAVQDVECRLRADHLRERRDHQSPSQVGAHGGDLLEYLLQPALKAQLSQLRTEVGDHAAGHLMLVERGVVLRGCPDWLVVAFGHRGRSGPRFS